MRDQLATLTAPEAVVDAGTAEAQLPDAVAQLVDKLGLRTGAPVG